MSQEETKTKILDEIFNKLDLKSLIDTAIFTALTKEAKDELVKGIMQYLSKQTDGYGNETHLQQAFNESIRTVVTDRMNKLISEDEELRTEIERCVTEASIRFIKLDKESLVNSLASVMTQAFSKDY